MTDDEPTRDTCDVTDCDNPAVWRDVFGYPRCVEHVSHRCHLCREQEAT